MLDLLKPLASLCIGLAMAGYGLVHAVVKFPGSDTFTTLAKNMPAMTAVLMFVLGLVACVAGVVLTLLGGRNMRRRWQRFNDLARHVSRGSDHEDERYEAGYR